MNNKRCETALLRHLHAIRTGLQLELLASTYWFIDLENINNALTET